MNYSPTPKTESPLWRLGLDFIVKLKEGMDRDHLPIVAAGVAFFLMLGIFPSLAALFSIYSWLADPMEIERQLGTESAILPTEVREILLSQIRRVTGDDKSAGWGAILSIALALWVGSRAMKGLIQGLNIVFSQSEKRGFIGLQVASLSLTLALIAMVASALLLIAGVPVMISILPGKDYILSLFSILRWPVLLVLVTFLLALVYRFGPSRNRATLRWVSPGAVAATLLWLVASALFSYYVGNFGSYHSTYGSLGAVAILMLWLYLTAFLILLGAEIDETRRHGHPPPPSEAYERDP